MSGIPGRLIRGSGRIGQVAAAVLVPAMLVIALLSWAFASPVGASPDDDYHMASIWCGGGEDSLCADGSASDQRRVPEALLVSPCFAFNPEVSGNCDLPASSDMVNTDRGNFDGSYPPVFYGTMSLFSGSDISTSILLMRAFNALLFVGVLTGAFFALRRELRPALLWGALITIVPLGMFIIPSVNPSSWAALSAATLWITLVGYFRATSTRSRVVLGGLATLATVMGAGARSDAAMYAGIAVVVAVVLTYERGRAYLLRLILPAALVALALVFFFASGQSAVVSPGASTGGSSASPVVLILANLVLLPGLWVGVLGTTGLGWLDTAMPASVWVSTTAAFFALIFWALQRLGVRKAIAMAIVFASLVMVPLYVLVKDEVLVGAGVQPRYVYPLLILLAGIAMLGLPSLRLGLSRLQLTVLLVLLTVANSVALHTNIRRYVTGTDDPGFNLDAGREWWWNVAFTPMAVWVVGSLAFAAAMVGVYLYNRSIAPADGGHPLVEVKPREV